MNAINLQRLRFNMKKFNCINDNLSHKDIEGLVENLIFGNNRQSIIWQLACRVNSHCTTSFRDCTLQSVPPYYMVHTLFKPRNIQPNKILVQHIVSFVSFMKTSSQTKVNLKYKFYTSSTFLFCTKLCVRAIRTLIS